MDIRMLNTFIQVAESGSFTRAGALLGYSQPTVSVQIKQLEQELGAKLFDRIGHTVRLTEKGHDVLRYAQQICHMCREMALETSGMTQPHGSIRLATADSLCTPLFGRAFSGFRARYPQISLNVTTAGTTELFRMLDHNEVDIVCTLDRHIYNANYVIAAEERIGVHFVASAGHPLAALPEVAVEHLLEQPFLLTEKGMSYRRILDEIMAQNSLEIHPVFEIGRADIICQLVEQGVGISFLPDYVTERSVTEGALVRLNVPGYDAEVWKQLLYHKDKWLSPQIRAAVNYFSEAL